MVMELCVGGEMFDRIVKKSMYTEDEARKCVAQMADALEYCHGQGIVHRDIKPENLLYARPDPDETVKIADFGLAHLLKKDEHLKTACGTPGYVAPEVLTGEGYGTEVDMWSIGVVVYILLCGYPPFYDDSTAILFNMIKKGEYDFNPQYWDAVSDSAKDFISQLLCVDPTARLSASGVKEVRAEQGVYTPWLARCLADARARTLSPLHAPPLLSTTHHMFLHHPPRSVAAPVDEAGQAAAGALDDHNAPLSHPQPRRVQRQAQVPWRDHVGAGTQLPWCGGQPREAGRGGSGGGGSGTGGGWWCRGRRGVSSGRPGWAGGLGRAMRVGAAGCIYFIFRNGLCTARF